jgi:hypothetical protein
VAADSFRDDKRQQISFRDDKQKRRSFRAGYLCGGRVLDADDFTIDLFALRSSDYGSVFVDFVLNVAADDEISSVDGLLRVGAAGVLLAC